MLASSRLTQKFQATIPQKVRELLGLFSGDLVVFEMWEGQVILRKSSPLDLEHLRATESTLSEWTSLEDDKAYRDL